MIIGKTCLICLARKDQPVTLNDWIQLNQIPASITPRGLCVVLPEDHVNRPDLWGLVDYSVSGSSNVIVWLEPTAKTEELAEIPFYVLPETNKPLCERLTTGPRLPEQYGWVRTSHLARLARAKKDLFDENGLIMEDDEGVLLGPTQYMKPPDMKDVIIPIHPLDGCFWVERTETWDEVA